jgi:hypothetical protein
MTMIGNICAGLASLVFLLLLAALSMDTKSKEVTGDFIVFGILSLLLFVLFSGAFSALTARQELDWLGWSRGAQYFGVIVSCLTLTIIVAFCATLRSSQVSDVPWAIRPFIPWGHLVLPPVAIAIAFCWLNKDLGIPTVFLRGAFAALCAIGVLTGLGLLGEVFISSQNSAAQKIDSIQERANERDSRILEQVKAADPEKDFGSLLAQSSKFERPAIRELALQKLLSNANFTSLMTVQLHHYYYYRDALTFLRDNDPPDKAALAEPIRDAFVLVAKDVRETMRTESNPRPSQFVGDAGDVLLVADKFSNYGVDYVPAIREYRSALDEPRQDKVDLDSRKELDRWLAKKTK